MPSEIFGVDGLVVLLFPVCFVLALWALIDAAIRPPVRPRGRCARNRLSDGYQAEAEAGGVSRWAGKLLGP
jgi:hypothetical protein